MSKIIDFILAKPKVQSNIESESKKAILASSEQLKLIDEVQKLKHMILHNNTNNNFGYEGFDTTINILKTSGMGKSFIDFYTSHIEKKCNISQLRNTSYMIKELKNFIYSNIKIYTPKEQKSKQRILLLVGASGSGKTSALFLLASHYYISNSKKSQNTSLRIASLDNYNIVAKELLDKYKSYLEIEGELFIRIEEFYDYIRKGKRPEILLVDTTGKSPKNKEDIVKMAHSLSYLPEKSEILLVIPANISENDIYYMLEEFKLLNYDGVIFTKIDEASNPGLILGACVQKSVPIAYLSYGKETNHFFEAKTELIVNTFIDYNFKE